MTDLSPAAQAIMHEYSKIAYGDDVELSFTPLPWERKAIAAALRAAADQVVPSDAMEPRNYIPMAIECQRIRSEILNIADELEDR
jgi:hypothetical protein